MYIAAVTLFMFLLPLLSVLTEIVVNKNHTALIALIGKWFVFWAIGIRLLTAGIRQVIKPGLTAEGILGIKDKSSWTIVRELGFANISMGLAGIISLWQLSWRPAVALIGGLFLLLDGAQHMTKKRNFEENVAMYSDLAIGITMALYLMSLI
jgi:hypothetical protein